MLTAIRRNPFKYGVFFILQLYDSTSNSRINCLSEQLLKSANALQYAIHKPELSGAHFPVYREYLIQNELKNAALIYNATLRSDVVCKQLRMASTNGKWAT
jgi:hypothetical protein